MTAPRGSGEDARVVVPIDVHDIRVLTATGPIDLPVAVPASAPAAAERRRRRRA